MCHFHAYGQFKRSQRFYWSKLKQGKESISLYLVRVIHVYARAVVHSLAIRFPNHLSERHLASNNIPVLIYFLEMEYPIELPFRYLLDGRRQKRVHAL